MPRSSKHSPKKQSRFSDELIFESNIEEGKKSLTRRPPHPGRKSPNPRNVGARPHERRSERMIDADQFLWERYAGIFRQIYPGSMHNPTSLIRFYRPEMVIPGTTTQGRMDHPKSTRSLETTLRFRKASAKLPETIVSRMG